MIEVLPPEPRSLDRYAPQARFRPLGTEGQASLSRARVALVGLGALGSRAAEGLARAGVGTLRLIDRDVVELSNLHRVALHDESDAEAARPKAVSAARHLRRLRSDLELDLRVDDLTGENALELLRDVDLVLDGSDNFETRLVLNEACLELGLPWVHAACSGSTAVAWALLPGRGACFACQVSEPPPPEKAQTCAVEGVIPPAVGLAVAVQVGEALKILSGREDELLPGPWTHDAWTGRGACFAVPAEPECAACARRSWSWLGRPAGPALQQCGRDAVQLRPASLAEGVDLAALADRLESAGEVEHNDFLVRLELGPERLTVFRDGRVLVSGTSDPGRARGLVATALGT
ncbi:MAG: ThiF family adenylyltransferase [Acidobacteriota bacterium]